MMEEMVIQKKEKEKRWRGWRQYFVRLNLDYKKDCLVKIIAQHVSIVKGKR